MKVKKFQSLSAERFLAFYNAFGPSLLRESMDSMINRLIFLMVSATFFVHFTKINSHCTSPFTPPCTHDSFLTSIYNFDSVTDC